jgi:hypothetical protein
MRPAVPIWYNYTIILPLKEQYDDDGSRDLFSTPISINGVGQFTASGIGSQNEIELIRIATIDIDGNLTAKQVESIHFNQSGSACRLAYGVSR